MFRSTVPPVSLIAINRIESRTDHALLPSPSLDRIRVAARRMRALDLLPPFPFSGSAARMNESRGERPPGMSPIPRVTLTPSLPPPRRGLKIAGSTDVIDLSSPDQNGEPVRNIWVVAQYAKSYLCSRMRWLRRVGQLRTRSIDFQIFNNERK